MEGTDPSEHKDVKNGKGSPARTPWQRNVQTEKIPELENNQKSAFKLCVEVRRRKGLALECWIPFPAP